MRITKALTAKSTPCNVTFLTDPGKEYINLFIWEVLRKSTIFKFKLNLHSYVLWSFLLAL